MRKHVGSGDLAARNGQWGVASRTSVGLGAAADAVLDVVLVARRGSAIQGLADGAAVDRIPGEAGDPKIGVLFYNAAAQPRGALLTVRRLELPRAMAVNCTAPTLLCDTILTDAYGSDPQQWRDATNRKARKGAPT